MKTFRDLRNTLIEANFKVDTKKLQLKTAKIKNVDVYYHSEKSGSKKVRVYVKPKGVKTPEELGVYKDIKTAEKSAGEFVKLMGEDIEEGVTFLSKVVEESRRETEIEEGKFVPTPKDLNKLSDAMKLNSIQKDILFGFMSKGKVTQKYGGRAAEEVEEGALSPHSPSKKKVSGKIIAKKMQKSKTMKGFANRVAKMKTTSEWELDQILPDYVSGGDIQDLFREDIDEAVGDTSIEDGVNAYVTAINNEMMKGEFSKQYKAKQEELKARAANKYWRLEMFEFGKARSIHAFVDKETGDIYKPAGWKAPAKGPRGNITDPSYISRVSQTRHPQMGGHLYKRG